MTGWAGNLRPGARIRLPLAVAVAPLVVAGVLAPLYSTDDFGLLTVWQAVVLWPIGALLLVLPVTILRSVERPTWFRLGLAFVA